MVCSHCAEALWSLVTTVQLSLSSLTWRLPALIIGSMVKIMPGSSYAGAGLAVVQHLRVFVKTFADAVAAVFTYHRKIVGFSMLLDNVADVAQMRAGFNLFDAEYHTFVCDLADAFGAHRWFADKKHLAGIAVVVIFDNGDINIDDVTFF